jgi:hypothetical protein
MCVLRRCGTVTSSGVTFGAALTVPESTDYYEGDLTDVMGASDRAVLAFSIGATPATFSSKLVRCMKSKLWFWRRSVGEPCFTRLVKLFLDVSCVVTGDSWCFWHRDVGAVHWCFGEV